MSPGNQGVFQLLKEVIFRRILVFYNALKWGHFGGCPCTARALLIGWWDRSEKFRLVEKVNIEK